MGKPLFGHLMQLSKENPSPGSITTAMLADGAVTGAKLSKPVAFFIFDPATTTNNIPSGAFTNVSFGTSPDASYAVDTGLTWTGPSTLTVNRAGFYIVGGGGEWDNSATGTRRLLALVGMPGGVQSSEAPAGNFRHCTVTVGAFLANGTVLRLQGYHDASTSLFLRTPVLWAARIG